MAKDIITPLSEWINRKHPLPRRFYNNGHIDSYRPDWMTWVGISESAPLHDADTLEWNSLQASRDNTRAYLEKVDELIQGLSGAWLDREEQEMILSEIGPPPSPCLPIYLISLKTGSDESLVYVGKTKTASRFSGGHSIALQLHKPEYQHFQKTVYRCCIWFHFDDEYIALDWIEPQKLSLDLLDSVESALISELQPPMNQRKRKKFCGKYSLHIHIQNFVGNFLNDEFIQPSLCLPASPDPALPPD